MKTEPIDRIADLGRLVAEQVPVIFRDGHDQINESINAVMEDVHDAHEAGQDKAAILSLSLSIKWDMDGANVVVELPVNVRRKFKQVCQLEDLNQPKLPFEEGTTMTVSAPGMEPVELTPESLKRAFNTLKERGVA
jgi:hypothetical protein